MKIIRWFFSHIFLILLIIIVIYSYMFWGNLTGENTPAGKAIAWLSDEFVVVEEFVAAIKEKQAQRETQAQVGAPQADASVSAAAEPSAQTAVAATENADPERSVAEGMAQSQPTVPKKSTPTVAVEVTGKKNTEVANADKMQETANKEPKVATKIEDPVPISQADSAPLATIQSQPVQQPPVSISYSHNNRRVMQNTNGRVETQFSETRVVTSRQGGSAPVRSESAEKTVIASTMKPDAADNFVSPEIERQLNNVDEQGKIIDQSQHVDDVRSIWIAARKSFYQRNYQLSEENYQKVIAATEDNFDAYGELGNVYFNQGKKKEAASAYYDAAAILVKRGELRRAKSLVGLLRYLDDNRATELQKLIESNQS